MKLVTAAVIIMARIITVRIATVITRKEVVFLTVFSSS